LTYGSSTYVLGITPEWGDITHVLSMTLNCSTSKLTSIQTMTNLQTLDENFNADLMDAMADRFEELEEAMRESDPQEWEGYDDES